MASLGQEDFEGAAAGTTISLTNTGYDNLAGSGTSTIASDQAYQGTRSAKIVTTNNNRNLRWDLAAPVTKLYARRYYRIDAAPTSGNPVRLIVFRLGTTNSVTAQANGANARWELLNGSTTVATSSAGQTIPAGAWFRLELGADLGAGTATLRVFTGANIEGTTPDVTLTGAATTTSTLDTIVDGQQQARTNTLWIDAASQDDATWPGSSSASGDLTDTGVALAAALTGAKSIAAAQTAGPLNLAAALTGQKTAGAALVAGALALDARLTAGTGSLRASWITLAAPPAGPAALRASWAELDLPAASTPGQAPKLLASWVELETGAVQAHVKTRKSGAWTTSPVKVRRVGAWR